MLPATHFAGLARRRLAHLARRRADAVHATRASGEAKRHRVARRGALSEPRRPHEGRAPRRRSKRRSSRRSGAAAIASASSSRKASSTRRAATSARDGRADSVHACPDTCVTAMRAAGLVVSAPPDVRLSVASTVCVRCDRAVSRWVARLVAARRVRAGDLDLDDDDGDKPQDRPDRRRRAGVADAGRRRRSRRSSRTRTRSRSASRSRSATHPNLWAARARLAVVHGQLDEARWTPFSYWSASSQFGYLPPIGGTAVLQRVAVHAALPGLRRRTGSRRSAISVRGTLPLYTFGKIDCGQEGRRGAASASTSGTSRRTASRSAWTSGARTTA